MSKRIFYIILLIFAAKVASFAQFESFNEFNSETKGIIYNAEKAAQVRFHTNGFAIGWYNGTIKTYYRTNFVHYEVGYLKDPHELSQRFDYSNPFNSQAARSFTFGKQNSLYVARVGWGQRTYYSDMARKRGVSIGSSYEFGGILGLQKPYYLELVRFKDNGTSAYLSTEKYSKDNKDIFTNIDRIFGGAGFFKAWEEIKPIPGVFGKAGLLFQWDTADGYFTGMEAGIQADVFPKKVPIMINQPNQLLFLNLYISVELGKRK